jgi:hypothetical protein
LADQDATFLLRQCGAGKVRRWTYGHDDLPLDESAPVPREMVLELTCDGDHGLFRPPPAIFSGPGWLNHYALAAGWRTPSKGTERLWLCPQCSGPQTGDQRRSRSLRPEALTDHRTVGLEPLPSSGPPPLSKNRPRNAISLSPAVATPNATPVATPYCVSPRSVASNWAGKAFLTMAL